jgi:hypothetical protein
MADFTVPRKGDWMQTFTGRQFWPLDPRSDEVVIEDIANSLAMQCRFGGHCLSFYSVAEHSVLLSRLVAPEHAMWALLHDGSEAYCTDVPRPLKRFLAGYAAVEAAIMAAICERFGLPFEMPEEVKIADTRILSDEAAQIMATPPVPWSTQQTPFGVRLHCWSPARASNEFLDRFREIFNG